jgi:hypothetical protein
MIYFARIISSTVVFKLSETSAKANRLRQLPNLFYDYYLFISADWCWKRGGSYCGGSMYCICLCLKVGVHWYSVQIIF